MLYSTRNKHLNNLLEELYKRVNQRQSDSDGWLRVIGATIRERTIAKALARESREIYDIVYRTIELVSTPNKKNIERHTAMLDETEKNLKEIQALLKTSELTKLLQDSKSPLQEAIEGDFSLLATANLSIPVGIKTALETLAKYGLLRKSVDIVTILAIPSAQSLPRGNPQKGGMVKRLMAKGFAKDKANEMAEEIINRGETTTLDNSLVRSISNSISANTPTLTKKQSEILAQLNSGDSSKSPEDLLSLLSEKEK